MYSQFEVSVLTDKTEYLVGENIEITVTTYDPLSNPIILNWPDACQYDVVIDGQQNIGCIFVPTQLTIESLTNHSWSFTYIETFDIGNHEIIGFVVNYGEPDTTSIHVRGWFGSYYDTLEYNGTGELNYPLFKFDAEINQY